MGSRLCLISEDSRENKGLSRSTPDTLIEMVVTLRVLYVQVGDRYFVSRPHRENPLPLKKPGHIVARSPLTRDPPWRITFHPSTRLKTARTTSRKTGNKPCQPHGSRTHPSSSSAAFNLRLPPPPTPYPHLHHQPFGLPSQPSNNTILHA